MASDRSVLRRRRWPHVEHDRAPLGLAVTKLVSDRSLAAAALVPLINPAWWGRAAAVGDLRASLCWTLPVR